ncbi:MAG: bis(5'-nucleosyl)-tetraphosphatase PrpE [Bacilli bacterium]
MNYDIIGDIHGCYDSFKQLTLKLGYSWASGIPIHPADRHLAFVGDLADRGPRSLDVFDLVIRLIQAKPNTVYVMGNHCDKLRRFMNGRKVQETHGLETILAEWRSLSETEREAWRTRLLHFFKDAPLYRTLDNGRLVIAHAGIRRQMIGTHSERVRTFTLYGDITGQKDETGFPVRRDWALLEKSDSPIIVYGHTPTKEVRICNGTYNIDTGCVFGGKLTALSYPDMTITSVPSTMPYVEEKFRTFDPCI